MRPPPVGISFCDLVHNRKRMLSATRIRQISETLRLRQTVARSQWRIAILLGIQNARRCQYRINIQFRNASTLSGLDKTYIPPATIRRMITASRAYPIISRALPIKSSICSQLHLKVCWHLSYVYHVGAVPRRLFRSGGAGLDFQKERQAAARLWLRRRD
jgi:hypothetical protein